MTRYDERYDEFGYEREDYDGTVQLNEYLTPREVMELLAIGKNTFFVPALPLAQQSKWAEVLWI